MSWTLCHKILQHYVIISLCIYTVAVKGLSCTLYHNSLTFDCIGVCLLEEIKKKKSLQGLRILKVAKRISVAPRDDHANSHISTKPVRARVLEQHDDLFKLGRALAFLLPHL